MNLEDFVENYISECIDNGMNSPKAICELALTEMTEIDEKLREANKLRTRYKNLKSVLKQFDHESLKRIKFEETPIYNENDNIKDYIHYNFLINICEFIESAVNTITPREIMDSIGDRENSEIIYGCIKTLGDNGIIIRDKDRNILKGPKWEDRPLREIADIA